MVEGFRAKAAAASVTLSNLSISDDSPLSAMMRHSELGCHLEGFGRLGETIGKFNGSAVLGG
jgi:hypothetical protein